MLRNSTKITLKTRDGDKTLTKRFLNKILIYSFKPKGSRINGWSCIRIKIDNEYSNNWEFNFNSDEEGAEEFEKLDEAVGLSEMDGNYGN